MSDSRRKRVIGVGSPVVDLLAQVTDEVVHSAGGAKGGMELVDSEIMLSLVDKVGTETHRAPGGSAANTIFALARMGVPCAFLGKLGTDDEAAFYREAFRSVGGDDGRFKVAEASATARCLSMVTPDSERTMRTDLAAASLLTPEEVTPEDFADCDHAHMEGYLLFNPELMLAALKAAQAAGCTVSLDLGSFEVVQAAGDSLPGLLERYVDVVFANEEEAGAYSGSDDPEAGLEALGKVCQTVAVKLGAEGALLRRDGEVVRVPAMKVDQALDTTGAGDLWAAGFLFGYLHDCDLAECGRLGAVLGAEVVQQLGAYLADEAWTRTREQFGTLWKGKI